MAAISVGERAILDLDLSPISGEIDRWIGTDPKQFDLELKFAIDYPQDPADPRELSEIAEIRLWFIRLDARYPYLPLLLDWQSGELSRYVAMLVPHQFSRKEGILYNPEGLEIWVMQRVFLLTDWLQTQQIAVGGASLLRQTLRERNEGRSRLKFMTQMLGYELDDGLFELLATKT